MNVDAVQALEQSWLAGQPKGLDEFLRERPSGNIAGEELSELAAVDLEWRWRVKNPQVKSPEEYWNEFPTLLEDKRWVMELVEAEFVARSRWSQPPRIDDYCLRFRDLGIGLRERLVERLNDVSLLVVRILGGAEVPGSYVLQSPLVLGRRRADSAETLGMSSDGRRLFICENSSEGVSREHCKIERVQRNSVVVTNLSRRGELFADDREVGSGKSVKRSVPVKLTFCGVKLLVEEM